MFRVIYTKKKKYAATYIPLTYLSVNCRQSRDVIVTVLSVSPMGLPDLFAASANGFINQIASVVPVHLAAFSSRRLWAAFKLIEGLL